MIDVQAKVYVENYTYHYEKSGPVKHVLGEEYGISPHAAWKLNVGDYIDLDGDGKSARVFCKTYVVHTNLLILGAERQVDYVQHN